MLQCIEVLALKKTSGLFDNEGQSAKKLEKVCSLVNGGKCLLANISVAFQMHFSNFKLVKRYQRSPSWSTSEELSDVRSPKQLRNQCAMVQVKVIPSAHQLFNQFFAFMRGA